MKKLIFSVIVLAALSAPLFAQKISDGKESEYFYVSVPIEKIYPYRKGYVVQYRKGVNRMAQVYLPQEWFIGVGDAAKGELVYQESGTAWPSMAVYYKGGSFSHVRLYIRRNQSHETWGTISRGTNIDDRFENIEDLKLEF
ncbi:hypothetical protein AGMMS49579_20170 [Spirochaetia bacterium]|nr:hypothetical protein AGMMS49579_20170 [Spirochaetia bacterium]